LPKDTRANMDGHATTLVAHEFALAHVNTSAYLDAEALDRFGNRFAATDCSRCSVKNGKKTVASRVNFAAAVALELLADEEVVMSEKLFPGAVAGRGRAPCRFDDVGK
jgi:hypothetical protein